MGRRNQVTIHQIASVAGVSAQTVSRVINDHPDVAPETRARVQMLIERMGYRPNAIARSLVHQRSYTLGVVTAQIDYYGPSHTLVGIEEEIRALGYSLLLDLLHHPEAEDVDQLLNRLLSHQVDGILWAVPEIGSNRMRLGRETARLHVPIVYLSMHPQTGLPVVAVDNYRGGRLAAEHLIAQGRRKVGIISGPKRWWESRERVRGCLDALRASRLSADERQVVEGDWSAGSGERGFLQLLAQFPQVDAVFSCNDQMALGLLKTAHRQGLRVPEDLAVVGFDNIPESAYFTPPLTTVEQHLVDLGSAAVRELDRMIRAAQDNENYQPECIAIQPELVIRESSVFSKNGSINNGEFLAQM